MIRQSGCINHLDAERGHEVERGTRIDAQSSGPGVPDVEGEATRFGEESAAQIGAGEADSGQVTVDEFGVATV